MKFHWKLLLAFYLPLHFAFGCFYLSKFMLGIWNYQSTPKGGFEICGGSYYDSFLYDYFAMAGFGLIILSIFLPSLILYRKYQAQPAKLFN